MGELVRLEVDGAIGTIRLDRPKMNALNGQVTAELREAAVEAGSRATTFRPSCSRLPHDSISA